MTNLVLAMVLAAPGDDLRITVTTKDGTSHRGTIALDQLSMKSSFGTITFDVRQIDTIEFGDSDTVTTHDKTKLSGRLGLDAIELKSESAAAARFARDSLKSLVADLGAESFLPGVIAQGTAGNRMSYYVRLPSAYDASRGAPALVLLHGSNMNAKAYVNTVVATWPKLADDYVLIGINGEHRQPKSPDDNPAFNYSGVSFVGRSKYKGYPGTDRESPALIPEVIAELKSRLNIGKLFVGGHSQGGFVTYSVFLNYPELVAGAFPISAGPWMQCEPTAFEDEDLRAAQRRGALAIIHGENDRVVNFTQGKSAYESFDDDGFPALRFFTDKTAGHMFARLPVEQAVRWLEQLSSDEPESLMKFAEAQIAAGEYRDACAAIARARSLDTNRSLTGTLDALERKIDTAASPTAKRLDQLIESASDDSWVPEFTTFRGQFQFAPAAAPVMDAYRKLRKEHEQPATKLWNEARADFQAGKQDAGYAKYSDIVQQYYASSWYRYAKPAVEQRSKK